MDTVKNKTVVSIAGREYTIVGSQSEDHIRRVAILVDRKIAELMHAGRMPQPMATVLTAVNLADELIHAQDENTRLRKELLELKSRKIKED